MARPDPVHRRLSLAVLVATGGGVGFLPLVPGTFGTLLGLPLAYGVVQLPGIALQIGAVAAVIAASIPICTEAARQLGRAKDPSAIVLDEIAALPIVFAFISPERLSWQSPWLWLAGFVLFRLFDITKPPPARQLERLPDGLGIVADDLAAAVYACAALHLLVYAQVVV
jgi:phosphatidylglycerophosphatase A